MRPERAGLQEGEFAAEGCFLVFCGGAAIDKPGREERSKKDEKEGEENQEEADEAGFEEEGEGFVLDDFFRGADFIGKSFGHSGTGATEANAEDESLWGLESGGEGDGVKAEADVGRFGDVTFEAGGFLFGVMGNVLKVFGRLEAVFGVFKVGLDGRFSGFGLFGIFGALGLFGEGAEIDETERELVDGLGDGGGESFGGGAEVGESSLETEGEEKSRDGDNDQGGAELMTDEIENEEDKEGDGVGVDGAAGEGEKEGSREKDGSKGEEDFLGF